MEINTGSYEVASLNDSEQALELIVKAEETIKQLTGNQITLIAYEKTDE